ncbi:MAG: carboxylesterase family protein [Velocimicrobium sp.]
MDMIKQIKYGKVLGVYKDGCYQYIGIPFARPPIGELAFRHPVEPDPWDEIYIANKGMANPIQSQGQFSVGNNSQDCLYMNIFVPQTKQENLPVMVWIYGGSYSTGGAGAKEPKSDDLCYNMAKFARETGTIVISFNYRLNLYGFLNLHFLDERFDMNCGLFDQIMVLRFVKENIGVFGGDTNNITLFGQSAGGACILALMSMPEAEGLFHKSIVMSACIDHFFTEKESENNTCAYLKLLSIETNEIDKLFELSPEMIQEANKRFSQNMLKHMEVRCAFSPVIDGVTLKKAPKEAVKKSKKPLLIGSTLQEANLYIFSLSTIVLSFLARKLKLSVNKGKESYKQRISDAVTDYVYNNPISEILNEYEGVAWRYKYKYVTPDGRNNGLRCCHASDVLVLFGDNSSFVKVDDEESIRVGTNMRSIWAQFAKEGKVNWMKYSKR